MRKNINKLNLKGNFYREIGFHVNTNVSCSDVKQIFGIITDLFSFLSKSGNTNISVQTEKGKING
jgi:hypothetical protein